MKLVLIEDEPLVAQRLERFCREVLGTSLERLHRASSYDEAAAWLGENAVDVMLLDLNLEGRDGMELLKRSVASAFHTVIVSANTDRALEAFHYGVLDFVPKPFTRERLAQALARACGPVTRGGQAARNLAIKKSGRIELVPVDDVLYVQGAGNYSELVLGDGRRELHDKTLEKLETLLPGDFERTHKSYLVRLSAIKALHADIAPIVHEHCSTCHSKGGIGPYEFSTYEQLKNFGVQTATEFAFRDHRAYDSRDMEKLQQLVNQSGANGFVTTEKDVINLGSLAGQLAPLYVVPLRTTIKDPDNVVQTLLDRLEKRRATLA